MAGCEINGGPLAREIMSGPPNRPKMIARWDSGPLLPKNITEAYPGNSVMQLHVRHTVDGDLNWVPRTVG